MTGTRKAFTLIELMLVIALMGAMGVLSVGGYRAVTRGMSERAALATARSLADAALQRAQIDRAPTYVFLFNEVLSLDSANSAGVVQGVAVAVRTCGRVTAVDGDLVCDEFGDLNRSFKSLVGADDSDSVADGKQKAAASTMRIYNLSGNGRGVAQVEEGVRSTTVTDLEPEEGGDEDVFLTWKTYGFRLKDSGVKFKVGDPYGQEFAVTRLPPGFTFSQTVPMSSSSDLGMSAAGQVIPIAASATTVNGITVYARRPNGDFESIGSTATVKDSALQ